MTMLISTQGDGDESDAAALTVLTDSYDREAEFTAFMAAGTPALTRTAWLLCGDVHQADELVQQALVRTYLSWPRARDGEPLAYARRVLANLRIDTWRKRRREILMDPSDLPEHQVPSCDARQADREQLARALAVLSARQRRVIVLRHFEGRSELEVASDLGVSVGTVKSTSSRGLMRLRSVLGAVDGSSHAGNSRTASTSRSHR